MKNSGNVVLGHIFLDSQRRSETGGGIFQYRLGACVSAGAARWSSRTGTTVDLGQAWSDNGGLVKQGVEANITKLADAAASFGFINIVPDSDGTLRHALLMIRYQDQDFFPSLDLEVVREYEKIPDQDIAAYIAPNGLERIQFGKHSLRPASDGSALLNYTGPVPARMRSIRCGT